MRDKRNNTLYPLLMAKPITEFLRDAYGILVKDMQEEGVDTVQQLKSANNFLAFCEENKESIEAFGLFIRDHRGVYDKYPNFYNWQTFEPFVEAIFRFYIDMPNKSRLLEMTNKYALAGFAMYDDDVARFVLANFDKYTEIKDKVEDAHGRAITILESIYWELCRTRGKIGSPNWALKVLIKKVYRDL